MDRIVFKIMKHVFALAIAFALVFFWARNSFASNLNRPTDVSFQKGMARFVDFKTMDASVVYDVDTKTVKTETVIHFFQDQTGYPIFDLVEDPTSVWVDDELVLSSELVLYDVPTPVRVLVKELQPGEHILRVQGIYVKNVKFDVNKVRSAFWFDDLSDRNFLELYLPANLEYDQFQMHLDVKVVGASVLEHQVMTNGELTALGSNHFSIDFPEYFTSSSMYFHLFEKGFYIVQPSEFQSVDGRKIPVIVYSADQKYINQATPIALKTLAELESDYGPFLHNRLTIYAVGEGGGMEYCGATATSIRAIEHEITHSYFARGIMPANGDAGWVDEALASWRDADYRRLANPGFENSDMGNRSEYFRSTDQRAYTMGRDFMSYLDYKLSENGGLKSVLAKMVKEFKFHPYTTDEFTEELNHLSGFDFTHDFQTYIKTKSHEPPNKRKGPKTFDFEPKKFTRQQQFNML